MGKLVYLGCSYDGDKFLVHVRNDGDFTEANVKVEYYLNGGFQGGYRKIEGVNTNQEKVFEFDTKPEIDEARVSIQDARTKQFIASDSLSLMMSFVKLKGSEQEPIFKTQPIEKEYVEVILGLWNPLKIVADRERVINAVNKICNFVGWNCFDAKCSVENITLYIEKVGSPALPIMAIIGAIAIIVAGAVIISINWRMVRVEEEDTKQEIEKTKQIESNEDLFNAITDEYNKGLITDETYNEIVEQLGYSQLQLSKPIQEKPKSIWGDMGEMLSGALPIILLIMLISAVRK